MAKGVLDLREMRVLVVEDDPRQRADMARRVQEVGCDVHVAEDGAAAVRQTIRLKPDLLLLDVLLPGLSGVEAMRIIRRRSGAEPYIIAVSAQSGADVRRRAFDAGCNEYIVKPMDVRGALRAYAYRRGGLKFEGSDSD